MLAAWESRCCFCVLLDARRPDLVEAWYSVLRCVKPIELKTALRVLTWQELAKRLPPTLSNFWDSNTGLSRNQLQYCPAVARCGR
ncbi:MAG: PGN_0703 family putative restriction endonuclease [Terriglobales bacterium]